MYFCIFAFPFAFFSQTTSCPGPINNGSTTRSIIFNIYTHINVMSKYGTRLYFDYTHKHHLNKQNAQIILSLLLLCPRTPQEPNDTAAVPHEIIEPVLLLLLLPLPLGQGGQEGRLRHDHVKVQPQEDGHPGLRQLVVPALGEPGRQGADEVQQLVGLVVVGGREEAEREGAQLQVGCGRGEGLEVFYEVVVWKKGGYVC